ncbi:type II secretion system protein N [Pseudoduganella violacea]|uniref:General secretion pathway protein C n=1 Tax=Pseudoduganella violacea TaxID=1715466 RepID=A0A7W5FWI8_9BURK|nr:type II secretion system protein N [Pseudoduganella violacea]MBB3121881.1 general secretion pathway protein C [Pseudoduganella violacea]
MKRLPLISTVAAVAALSASLAYWGLQLYKPQQRPIAAPPVQAAPGPQIDSARGLFGGEVAVAAASSYQLRGVVAAANGRGSVAIIATDSQPAKAFPVGAEVVSGVTVKEVQPRFVLLQEGGVQKRVDLMPVDSAPSASLAPPLPGQPGQPMSPPPNVQPQSPMTGGPAEPTPGPILTAPPQRVVTPPPGNAPPQLQ